MKIRLGLAHKLLLAFLSMSLLLTGLLAGVLHWSFQRGFLDYVRRLELERLDPLAKALIRGYAEHESWDYLRQDPSLWPALQQQALALGAPPVPDGATDGFPKPARRWPGSPGVEGIPPATESPPRGTSPLGPIGNAPPVPPSARVLDWRPPPRSHSSAPGEEPFGFPGPVGPGGPVPGVEGWLGPGRGVSPPGPPFPPPGAPGLHQRIVLLDSDKHNLIGLPVPRPGALLLPMRYQDDLIGWLSLAPLPALTDAVDLEFQRRQATIVNLTALLALVLAVLISIPLAQHLLGPIRDLTRGLSTLTRGRFGTRTHLDRSDELGELASGFNQLAETLEKNERLRRQWLADVSHELRTPLAVLAGEVDAVVDGVRPWNEERRESLQLEVGNLNKLVDDLYQLALSDLGALSYRKGDLELESLLEKLIERRRSEFADRRLALETELCWPAARILGDPDRLTQLFDNLFQNSLRYTDAGGCLRVSTRREGQQLLIDFQDGPPGVPDDVLPQLFERLYRVEKSRSRAGGGAGLGLAICRNIVEAHGGRILARRSPQGGLWIEIRLPLAHH